MMMSSRLTVSLLTSFYSGLTVASPMPRCDTPAYPTANHTILLYPPYLPLNGLFSADVVVGNQTLRAGLDTGSSDTWFLAAGANCTQLGGTTPVPNAQCGIQGPRYNPDSSFELIPNTTLERGYGSGTLVAGPLGYSQLVFGGLTIPQQEIGVPSIVTWGGDYEGNVSGLIGLAYPDITHAFPGTNITQIALCSVNMTEDCQPAVPYSPLTTTIFRDNFTEPLFALALSRGSTSGGVMTIGGIPALNDSYINATNQVVATAPIEVLANNTGLQEYVVSFDGFQYEGAPAGTGKGQYIIDSGTGLNVLPKADVEAISALFDPPAVQDSGTGLWTVLCNASAPEFGVQLGGQVFYHNTEDMIVTAPGQVICYSAVQGSLATEYAPILGASFLKNVLAVFDVGQTQMTFMSRVYYEDS